MNQCEKRLPATHEGHLRAVVEYLCSDVCLPRLPGTEGGLRAREYIEQSFAHLGLQPIGEDGYLQHIPAIGGANVIGMVPGASSKRSIIIGAHFDACAIDGGVNPGASDNAASVAVMLETARVILERSRLEPGVVFIGFDAEEPPYFQTPNMGSRYFVSHPTIDIASVDVMICLDMVGHTIGRGQPSEIADTVIVFGSEKSRQVSEALGSVASVAGLGVRRLDVDLVDQVSDYSGFQDAGVPFLFYNALRNDRYHATTDTPDHLDFGKLVALVTHLVGVIEQIASSRADTFTYDASARGEAASLATLQILVPTLPEASRFFARAPRLLEDLTDRVGGLGQAEWQLTRRIFAAIEDGLCDARLWDSGAETPPPGRGSPGYKNLPKSGKGYCTPHAR